jgi:hypothetical protein
MIDDDMVNDDLERRLGDLFAGPGLDLVPRTGATAAVSTRVRRARRRRRAIHVAAPILTAACLTGVILATQGARDLGASAPPAGSVTGTTDPTSIASPGGSELAMTGTAVGRLRLGMTAGEAEATGLLDTSSKTPDAEKPDCTDYSGRNGLVRVQIGRLGVADIEVYPFIHTPEGVAIGDTYQRLHTAYPVTVPATPDTRESYRVPVPGVVDGWYEFRLEGPSDGNQPPTALSRIAGLSLRNNDDSCG